MQFSSLFPPRHLWSVSELNVDSHRQNLKTLGRCGTEGILVTVNPGGQQFGILGEGIFGAKTPGIDVAILVGNSIPVAAQRGYEGGFAQLIGAVQVDIRAQAQVLHVLIQGCYRPAPPFVASGKLPTRVVAQTRRSIIGADFDQVGAYINRAFVELDAQAFGVAAIEVGYRTAVVYGTDLAIQLGGQPTPDRKPEELGRKVLHGVGEIAGMQRGRTLS